MPMSSAGEAFFTAQEMEKRAIRLYERALMLFGQEEPLKSELQSILREEREHLRRFENLGGEFYPSHEERALLSAKAADALFSGGLVEASRMGAFDSPAALFAYAASEEQKSAAFYQEMSDRLLSEQKQEAARALSEIAHEEICHHASLIARKG